MQPLADIGSAVAFITGAAAGDRPDRARPLRKMLLSVYRTGTSLASLSRASNSISASSADRRLLQSRAPLHHISWLTAPLGISSRRSPRFALMPLQMLPSSRACALSEPRARVNLPCQASLGSQGRSGFLSVGDPLYLIDPSRHEPIWGLPGTTLPPSRRRWRRCRPTSRVTRSCAARRTLPRTPMTRHWPRRRRPRRRHRVRRRSIRRSSIAARYGAKRRCVPGRPTAVAAGRARDETKLSPRTESSRQKDARARCHEGDATRRIPSSAALTVSPRTALMWA